jgi:hypothetical protein
MGHDQMTVSRTSSRLEFQLNLVAFRLTIRPLHVSLSRVGNSLFPAALAAEGRSLRGTDLSAAPEQATEPTANGRRKT